MAGTLFVVATPIGNLEDITLRALRILREVSLIAAEDTRRTAHLLARHGITTPTTSLHEHNERQKSASVVNRLRAGDDIALVSDAGTPAISDPGSLLVRSAVEAGIRVEAIPGPSAIIAALSILGRQIDFFAFLGFAPTRSTDRKKWLARLAVTSGVVVFFEAPHRIHRTLGDILAIAGDIDILLTRELTKSHEESVRGHISEVLSRLPPGRGEYTVIAEIGLTPDITTTPSTDAAKLALEFGELTNLGAVSKRRAITNLAKRYNLSVNDVYSAIESAKKSGE
jgi:16S rRNA (cytidine1402-2'-O)-methyltransferase